MASLQWPHQMKRSYTRSEGSKGQGKSVQDSNKIVHDNSNDIDYDPSLWSIAWKVWLNIGTNATKPPDASMMSEGVYVPSQAFLTALIQTFPPLFEHIKTRFVASDLQKLSTVLKRALCVPVHGDASPFIIPSFPDVTTTPLQEATLQSIEVLIKVRCMSHQQTSHLLVFTLTIYSLEVAGWTVDREIWVPFPAYPLRVLALWWQGGKRPLQKSGWPCQGRLGMLKTPSCPWCWVLVSRSKFGNWITVPSLYSILWDGLNFLGVPIFVVFVEGPIHEI